MTKSTKPDAGSIHDDNKLQFEVLEKNLNEKRDELSRLIQQHPITSVCVALGIGFLVGKLLSDKK